MSKHKRAPRPGIQLKERERNGSSEDWEFWMSLLRTILTAHRQAIAGHMAQASEAFTMSDGKVK